MTANDRKSCLSIFESFYQKKSINIDYSPLTETIDTNSKAPKHEIKDRIRITKYTKYKDSFSKY